MENSTAENLTALEEISDPTYTDEQILFALRSTRIEEMYGEHYELNFHATTAFFALGLVTNVLNLAVLRRTAMGGSLNLLLMVLSVTDILHLTIQFGHAVHYYAGFKLYPYYDWVVFYVANSFLESVFLCACAWLVAAIGIWRFLAITWPLRSREYCTRYRAKLTVCLIYLSSVVLNCTVFLINEYRQVEFLGIVVHFTEHSSLVTANDGLGLKIIFAIHLLKGVVPMIVILVMSLGLIVNLYRIRLERKKALNVSMSAACGHRITFMLLGLLVLYFVSNFTDSFLYFVGVCCPDAVDDYISQMDVIRFLSLVSNSTTFFIYYGLGADFRKTTHQLLCPRALRRGKRQTSRSVSNSTGQTSGVFKDQEDSIVRTNSTSTTVTTFGEQHEMQTPQH